jgi:Domain of unknown function (DUF4112)
MPPIGDAPASPGSSAPPPWLRFWADLLDSRFRIPGTDIRFGIDPILSLIPGFGDLASPIFTVVLLVQGLRQHVPRVVMVRMVVNALIDALIGVIPVAGNIGDIFWRANNLNLALLERHAQAGRPPTPGDYAFVWLIALVLGLLILVPVLIALWLATVLWHFVAGR